MARVPVSGVGDQWDHTGGPAVQDGLGSAADSDSARLGDGGHNGGPSRGASAESGQDAAGAGDEDVFDEDDYEDMPDPPDEPAPEMLLAGEIAILAERDDEVIVVDGRPRYHLEGCSHLPGKDGQPLPVSEAVELGFTPCSRCAAATTLLAH